MLLVVPTLTDSGRNATIDYGDVHSVTCRADGEDPEYDLVKEGAGGFGFRSSGSAAV